MNKLNKTLASFLILILVLSFYIVPKEFVHAFFGHEDTADHITVSSGKSAATIGSQHVHCNLLNFETDFFYSHPVSEPETAKGIFFSYFPLALNATGFVPFFRVSLRGPPCSC